MSSKPSIAVILAGCGNKDGAEIHEATLTLWAIHRHGADYQCYAPDKKQHHVLNHITGEEMAEERNVLIESARIARGNIKSLAQFDATAHDVLILTRRFRGGEEPLLLRLLTVPSARSTSRSPPRSGRCMRQRNRSEPCASPR